MGAFVWLAVGILVAILLREVARRLGSSIRPSAIAAVVGALVGGFAGDLLLRGDSVGEFRGPTTVGAVVGAALLVGVVYFIDVVARRATGRRQAG